MTAAHVATALVIKSRVPRVSAAALIAAAFVSDFVWIALAIAGIEPARRDIFFDDWSHSLVMVALYAAIATAAFWRRGRDVAFAMGLAVLSHFVLDFPVHTRDLALYPHAAMHLGIGLSQIAAMSSWFLELGVVVVLLVPYVAQARRFIAASHVFASCVLIVGWHIMLMPGSS